MNTIQFDGNEVFPVCGMTQSDGTVICGIFESEEDASCENSDSLAIAIIALSGLNERDQAIAIDNAGGDSTRSEQARGAH